MNREMGGYSGREDAPKKTPEGEGITAEQKPDIREFHEKAKAAGAYDEVDERRRALMEVYFTTPASYEELRPLAGGITGARVEQLIKGGLRRVIRSLPPELREEYFRPDENFEGEKIPRTLADFEWPQKPGQRKPHKNGPPGGPPRMFPKRWK